jgi:hypothetical protein
VKWLIARRVLNIVAISGAVTGVALLAWVNLFGGRVVAAQVITNVTWGFWGAIAMGYAVRLVLNMANKRRAITRDPLASAGETFQDIYLGRVSTPAPQREPDEYSAYGSAPPRIGEDVDYPAEDRNASQ